MTNKLELLNVKINELEDKVRKGEIEGDKFIAKIFEIYTEIQDGNRDPLIISYLLEDVLFELGEETR